MNVNELQNSYPGGGSTWTKHGADGLAPNTVQYDRNGDAEHHITVNHDAMGVITGLHYTIRNNQNSLFHLHYYKDTNTYFIDFAGTRSPQTISIQTVKAGLVGFCLASQYAVNAGQGQVTNLTAFQEKIDLAKADQPQQRKNKKGYTVLDLTGGGQRRY